MFLRWDEGHYYFCDNPNGSNPRPELHSLVTVVNNEECSPHLEDGDLIFVFNADNEIAQVRAFRSFDPPTSTIVVYEFIDKSPYYTQKFKHWAYFCKEWAGLTGEQLGTK